MLILLSSVFFFFFSFEAGERNIRFILRGCLEQQGLGCLPASDVVTDLEPVFQDVGFDFTVLGSTGSACYCDGNLCNMNTFTSLQNSMVTCAFCVSTAFPDPALSAVNTDQNVPCEQGTIDGINVVEVSCPIVAGYSCDTSVNDVLFLDPECEYFTCLSI
ncbi:hypothetical protein HOLleu_43680 [Holothuria leucospilota]|uniref:Uncharacterized protein n=1 Tax=Holothuria leucospilota TaxID=206669 RepID=A0A9Q1BAL9_HOLLE|nr:hypothetical protein HOLleu_43680 [Holothuria leucospilota]